MSRPSLSDRRTLLRRIRLQTWLAITVVGMIEVLLISWILMTLDTPSELVTKLSVLGILIVAFIFYFMVQTRRWRNATRRALAVGGRLCPNCLYPLAQSASPAPLPSERLTCPECGESWHPSELDAHWSVGRKH